MIEAMQHSCSVARRCKNYTLNYDGGTAVFTAGATLTGTTSHATAIIVSTGVVASGTLTLHTITGTFQNNEPITDNNAVPGAAVVDGTIADAADAYGQPTYTNVTSTVKCRFVNPKGGMRKIESGEHIYNLPAVVLPSGTTITEGDTLTGVTSGFTRAYRVMHVRTIQADEGISHIRCDLEAVT